MQPAADISDKQEDDRIPVLILDELGQTLRASFDAPTEEPIPGKMALLLLRIAFAQALERIAEEEARQFGEALSHNERILAFASPRQAA